MKKLYLFTVLVIMVFGCQTDQAKKLLPEPGKQLARNLNAKVVKTYGCDYLLYLPLDYKAQGQKKWPLMIFLHGASARGNNLDLVKKYGPPKLVEKGMDFPFILVSPQCPEKEWWDNDTLVALIDQIESDYQVDPDRIYLTGLSMGGFGTWHLAAAQPGRFAAIVPICGGGDLKDAAKIKKVSIRVYHGAKDLVVPIDQSKDMVEVVKKSGGNIELIIYPESGHDCWTVTYDNPELYEWFLKQKRAKKQN